MTAIKCSGFGGQGVLTAGLILSSAAMDNGLEVTWIPSYGSEMRGGLATCNIRMGTTRIGSPFIKNMDILIAMNANSVSLFEDAVIPGGLMLVNSSLMPENTVYRKDITVIEVAANTLAAQAENPRGANIVLLAAAVAAGGLFEKECFTASVTTYFGASGKVNPKNDVCINLGWEAILNRGQA